MELPDGIGDLQIRAYFASIVGAFRAPFGRRNFAAFVAAGQQEQLIENSSRDKVLSVTVSRADLGGVTQLAIFAQQTSAGTNDFSVSFLPTSLFRFVLRPSESLTLQLLTLGPMNVVIGSEAY